MFDLREARRYIPVTSTRVIQACVDVLVFTQKLNLKAKSSLFVQQGCWSVLFTLNIHSFLKIHV